MDLDKRARLLEFFRRLMEAPRQSSFAGALSLVRVTLDAVEDELTSIPNNPENWETDGRLYPPQDDAARPVRPGVIRYRNKKHNTLIADNGAIEIQDDRGKPLFEKAGADGLKVSEL